MQNGIVEGGLACFAIMGVGSNEILHFVGRYMVGLRDLGNLDLLSLDKVLDISIELLSVELPLPTCYLSRCFLSITQTGWNGSSGKHRTCWVACRPSCVVKPARRGPSRSRCGGHVFRRGGYVMRGKTRGNWKHVSIVWKKGVRTWGRTFVSKFWRRGGSRSGGGGSRSGGGGSRSGGGLALWRRGLALWRRGLALWRRGLALWREVWNRVTFR
jgi:uncharacterized membrane protein YgcG